MYLQKWCQSACRITACVIVVVVAIVCPRHRRKGCEFTANGRVAGDCVHEATAVGMTHGVQSGVVNAEVGPQVREQVQNELQVLSNADGRVACSCSISLLSIMNTVRVHGKFVASPLLVVHVRAVGEP